MPTGYTADVVDGKVTDFADFAWGCARAFGALISMRDEPHDAPIPDEIKPSTYHHKRLVELRAELERVSGLNADEATAAASREHLQRITREHEYWQKAAKALLRCQDILAKVHAWNPPSAEHVILKKFMIEQLEETARFDGPRTPEPPEHPPAPTGEEWRAGRIASIQKSIEYHEREHAAEVERNEERTRWIRQLRESLA